MSAVRMNPDGTATVLLHVGGKSVPIVVPKIKTAYETTESVATSLVETLVHDGWDAD